MAKSDREYRALSCVVLRALEDRPEGDLTVHGYATTFEDPYVLWTDPDGTKCVEIVDRHALDAADMSDVIMQYDHAGKVLARRSNDTLRLTIDEHGLKIDADLSKSQAARALYEEIDNRLVTRMSWAFVVDEDSVDHDREGRTYTRRILRVKKIYDVSAVSLPADPNTYIAARSALDGAIEAERRRDLERQRLRMKLKIGGTER